MKKWRWIIFFTVSCLIALGVTSTATASIDGCPSTWNLKVESRPGQPLPGIPGEDPETFFADGFFYESSGELDAAIKKLGRNIAYKYYPEWSLDGNKWIDIFAQTTDSRGYFTNSFEAQPGIFVHFDQLFRFFQGGRWRLSLKVETADCPNNIGIFSSNAISINYSIFEEKKYDLKELYLSKTQLNFKDVEWHLKELEDWKTKVTLDLNSYGVARSVPDLPNSSNIVVAASGNPPCMNYVNRNWKTTNIDCVLDIFYVHRLGRGNNEYYLVDQIEIKYASLMKAKALAEAKASADSQAKSNTETETQPKIASDKQAAEARARALSEAKAKAKTYISCSKGNQIKRVVGANAKCPKGFKKIS